MRADQIIAAARECIGTPFAHQGRIVGMALDCAGVAVHVAQHWHTVDQPAAYGRLPHDAMLEHWLDRQPYLRRESVPQAGDILLMCFTGEPQHLAVYSGATIIHAYQSFGRVVEHRLDEKWRKRIVRAYRFAEVEV